MYNATDGHGAGLQRGGNAMPGKQKGQVVNRPHGNNKVAEHFRKYYQLWLLALPGIALTLMFAYIPMSGLVIIFKDYNFKDGIFGSPWVGLKNFEFFFANFSNAWRATKNTIILNLFYTVFGTVAAVGLAIMFNEIRHKKFLKVSQSLSIMPYFISWVVAGGILRALLNYDGGANLWQRIRYITIPLLKPTIIILFLLSIGKIMSGDLTMMMSITNLSPMLLDTTDIIDTYVYRSVIGVGDFVMGSAVGLYQSIFGFILVLFSNWLVGRFDKDYQLF